MNRDTIIENPVLNSLFAEPCRHFRLGDEGITGEAVEVTGEKKRDKAATVDTLWVPAVNNHGAFGRWAFLEIDDPWDAKNAVRALLQARTGEAVTT